MEVNPLRGWRKAKPTTEELIAQHVNSAVKLIKSEAKERDESALRVHREFVRTVREIQDQQDGAIRILNEAVNATLRRVEHLEHRLSAIGEAAQCDVTGEDVQFPEVTGPHTVGTGVIRDRTRL